jgi:hypothetical protein
VRSVTLQHDVHHADAADKETHLDSAIATSPTIAVTLSNCSMNLSAVLRSVVLVGELYRPLTAEDILDLVERL